MLGMTAASRLAILTSLVPALLGASLALSPARAADTTVPNPHDTTRPGYCLDCHTEEVYSKDCDAPEGFCLLADSVDALCLLCHLKEDCCRTGQEHQARLYLGAHSHVSGVEVRDVERRFRPTTLPVQDGVITCRTCHLHNRPQSGDYKMLRIVKTGGSKVDWSGLFADCHADY